MQKKKLYFEIAAATIAVIILTVQIFSWIFSIGEKSTDSNSYFQNNQLSYSYQSSNDYIPNQPQFTDYGNPQKNNRCMH